LITAPSRCSVVFSGIGRSAIAGGHNCSIRILRRPAGDVAGQTERRPGSRALERRAMRGRRSLMPSAPGV
jgi:hypothetical protein